MITQKLVLDVYKRIEEATHWVNAIPIEIRESYFDNPMVNTYESVINLLLEALSSEEETDQIYWLIYDWAVNKGLKVKTKSGVIVTFNSPEEVVRYLGGRYNWPVE
jgi:hypothetical protein